MKKAQIGLIGLATMGANLARNLSNKKVSTIVYNRTTEKTEEFIKEFGNQNLEGAKTIKEFLNKLELPRKIIILVKAGDPVDMVIKDLLPLLDKNDILIDCGNSYYKDTKKRQLELKSKNINFIGCGISGGEFGALHGPSMMPGGDKKAYLKIAKILEKISANDGEKGKCVSYIGEESSGHFVKMVHNGIEYGIMQLIAESYDLLKNIGNLSNKELADIFSKYNKIENLNSYLIEISGKIFPKQDGKKFILDYITDAAGQKGTGKWTTEEALNLGVAIPTITAAVDARIISGDINGRKTFGKTFKNGNLKTNKISKKELIEMTQHALELSTILTYIQGLKMLQAASEDFKWKLNLKEIARIWKNGCIIRSKLLDKFAKDKYPEIYKNFNGKKQSNWRKFMNLAISNAIPIPAMSASLNYFDSLKKPRLPQNLIQAQRDFFGAHGYTRTDKTGSFHTEW